MELRNGLHFDVPAHVYHSDPCERPSLSSRIAHTLVAQSPKHAWTFHPRLGGLRRDHTTATEKGSIIHCLLLGEEQLLEALDFPDYRTKLAKQARDDVKAAGRIPLLRKQYDAIEATADIIRRNIEEWGIRLAHHSEVTAIWEDEGVRCRARMDKLSEDQDLIQDLKSCASAHPDAIARSIFAHGYDIQEAAYRRSIEALRPDLAGHVQFQFIFFELEPPYSVTPVRLGGSMRELGERRWQRARERWRRCLESGDWPGYVTEPLAVEAPQWALASDLDEEFSEPETESAPQPVRHEEQEEDDAASYF